MNVCVTVYIRILYCRLPRGPRSAAVVPYATLPGIQRTPSPATVRCAPEARDWATSWRHGVAPAPTVFMVMACLTTKCLLCRNCTWNMGYSAMELLRRLL